MRHFAAPPRRGGHLSRVTWYRRSWPRTRCRGAGDAYHITTVESSTFAGASFGLVGQYERIEGTFAGEVDPKDRSAGGSGNRLNR